MLSVGIRDSIEAINGIGHAAVATSPDFRRVLAAHGFTLDPDSGEIRELAPYVGASAAGTRRSAATSTATKAPGVSSIPAKSPGHGCVRRGTGGRGPRHAWTRSSPRTVESSGSAERTAPGARLPRSRYSSPARGDTASVDRPRRSSRPHRLHPRSKEVGVDTADIRGRAEVLLAQTCLVAEPAVRVDLAEDITARATHRCLPLLKGTDVPEHVRCLSSPQVLDVEADLIARIAALAAHKVRIGARGLVRTAPTQPAVVGALAGDGPLVVEGAAGAGKTTALRSIHDLLSQQGRRLMVVTPTLKAAEVAAHETGAEDPSAGKVTFSAFYAD
jgi:exodeoxyribonuclease V alpha subunit